MRASYERYPWMSSGLGDREHQLHLEITTPARRPKDHGWCPEIVDLTARDGRGQLPRWSLHWF
jgi:hypothetical protein